MDLFHPFETQLQTLIRRGKQHQALANVIAGLPGYARQLSAMTANVEARGLMNNAAVRAKMKEAWTNLTNLNGLVEQGVTVLRGKNILEKEPTQVQVDTGRGLEGFVTITAVSAGVALAIVGCIVLAFVAVPLGAAIALAGALVAAIGALGQVIEEQGALERQRAVEDIERAKAGLPPIDRSGGSEVGSVAKMAVLAVAALVLLPMLTRGRR